jgi:hypothetical protein
VLLRSLLPPSLWCKNSEDADREISRSVVKFARLTGLTFQAKLSAIFVVVLIANITLHLIPWRECVIVFENRVLGEVF